MQSIDTVILNFLFKAVENIENRKKRPGYNPYDEVDEDTGMVCV